MAYQSQDLTFGDFENLNLEEKNKVREILYRPRAYEDRKVEFPWDDEVSDTFQQVPSTDAKERNDGGLNVQGLPHQCHAQQEYPTSGGMPRDVSNVGLREDGQIRTEIPREDIYVGQFSNQSVNYGDTAVQFGYDPCQSDMSQTQAGGNKQYERRNKKKRPPGYYQKLEEEIAAERQSQSSNDSPVNWADLSPKPVPGHGYEQQTQPNYIVQDPAIHIHRGHMNPQAAMHQPSYPTQGPSPGMGAMNATHTVRESTFIRQEPPPMGGINHPQVNTVQHELPVGVVCGPSVPREGIHRGINNTYQTVQDGSLPPYTTQTFSTANQPVVNYTIQQRNISQTESCSVPHPQSTTSTVYPSHQGGTSQTVQGPQDPQFNSSCDKRTTDNEFVNIRHQMSHIGVSQSIDSNIHQNTHTTNPIPSHIPNLNLKPHVGNVQISATGVHVSPQQAASTVSYSKESNTSEDCVNKLSLPQNKQAEVEASEQAAVSREPQGTESGGESVVSPQSVSNKTNSEPTDIHEHIASDQKVPDSSSQTVQADTPAPEIPAPKPKVPSWAGLFKNVTPPASSPVAYSVPYHNSSPPAEVKQTPVKEVEEPSAPVSVDEDRLAKDFGEALCKLTVSHAQVGLMPRGLVNRGNWCYINATLQALVACPPFCDLLRRMPKFKKADRGPSSTPVLDSMVEFMNTFSPYVRSNDKGPQKGRKTLQDINQGKEFEPSNVYKMLQVMQANQTFKLGRQEDAEEFLSCVLDGLHEEMAAVMRLVTGKEEQSLNQDGEANGYVQEDDLETEMPEDSWEQVGPKKRSAHTRRAMFSKSPIADIFVGYMRSAVFKSAAKESATLQPFFTLQLDIQSENVFNVRDALDRLVIKESISGYTCTKTNQQVEIAKKVTLEELPPVLIMHLKYFVFNKDGGSQKLLKKIDYPIDLEITRDLLSPNVKSKLQVHQRSYKLFAVVFHHGKLATGGGHYTTAVFHPVINGWISLDDSSVQAVPVQFVLKYNPPRVPYLLYYRRLDVH